MIYFFLLSLFYISTTTRHTLENRRFLEANSNEKFCGTIRETLCECAAPSSMESYIYNIACSCVLIYVACMYLYAFPCVLHVCGCICVCLRVLQYSLSLSFSLVSSLLFFHSRALSLFSFFTLFLSRPFALLSPHIHMHTFFPPTFLSLSLSYFLTFRVRSPLSMYRESICDISMELNSTRNQEAT